MKRRELFSITAGLGVVTPGIAGTYTARDLLNYLCPPGNLPDQLSYQPSPYAEPFKAELFIPPVMPPQEIDALVPPADPRAHQLWGETLYGTWDLTPKKSYQLKQKEFPWQYHPDEPYASGSISWGWEGPEGYSNALGENRVTPGPTVHLHYGEAVVVRQKNDLPPIQTSLATFALPSTSIHLHNGHQASESDGNPQDWIDSGEFWDHNYPMFPSGGDEREKLTTLWYHDHRLDFTASNVYAGLSGFCLYFDELDTGDENDPDPQAWRLPSGKYDVPLMFHDVLFNEVDGRAEAVFNNFYTDGWLGDQVTINRTIRPFMDVEARKYRFRIVNGGPSRFYQFSLAKTADDAKNSPIPMIVVTGDGNFLSEPILANNLLMSVAQRYDIIIDFSHFEPGEEVILWNVLEQTNGKGPSGRILKEPDGVLKFKVKQLQKPDNSQIPSHFRELPDLVDDLSKLPHRVWDFDYDGGLWTINGLVMDPNRIDAGIVKNSAEVWTFRNTGNDWSHPVHCHFTEFLILEVNGKPYYHLDGDGEKKKNFIMQTIVDGKYRLVDADGELHTSEPLDAFLGGPRRDVATILPGDEMKVLLRFMDFEGRHVMHCHNVVHEDHAMMIRWDILPEEQTKPIMTSVPAGDVWGDGFFGESSGSLSEAPFAFDHVEPRPATAGDVEPSRGRGNFPPQAPKTKEKKQ
ncbi:MAG: FtsP/CotA-like multicopper oxidase with cupredoxin domain [Arenicella sp.]